MKKESFGNSRKCLGQKNLGASDFKIPEVSLTQLILEQFTVNPDKSTTLDAIGNIIGPGYTPDIESDRQIKSHNNGKDEVRV